MLVERELVPIQVKDSGEVVPRGVVFPKRRDTGSPRIAEVISQTQIGDVFAIGNGVTSLCTVSTSISSALGVLDRSVYRTS